MLKLRRMYARNWVKIAESTVVFPDHGLVVVLGTNHAGRGKLESVGSGKTSLGEAIARTLLGINGRYGSVGHYSRDDAGDTYVSIEAQLDGGQKLTVEMGYKCVELSRTGAGLRFTVGSNPPIERATIDGTRAELIQTVGLTPSVADWTVFLDGERLKFNKLSQAEALDLLMQALDQPPWQQYHERSTRELTIANENNISAGAKLESSKADVVDAQAALTTALERKQEAEKLYAEKLVVFTAASKDHALKVAAEDREIGRLKTQKKTLQDKIKNTNQPPSAEIVKALAENETNARTAVEYLAGWELELQFQRDELNTARLALDRLMSTPSNCPTCERPWDRRPIPATITAARQKYLDLEEAVKTARTQTEQCRADIQAAKLVASKLHQQLETARSALIAPFEKELDHIESLLETHELAHSKLTKAAPAAPVDNRLATAAVAIAAETRAATAVKGFDTTVKSVEATERAKLLAKYWTSAFSPAGLPNMALRAVIDPLNETAKTVGATMTGGVIDVVFEATTELASGQPKPQLVTRVNNLHGATRLSGSSKGEAGLTNLIIAETQAEIGRVSSKIGFRWFDEAVNSEDPVVRRNIYQYLRRQAAERQILIFVVDHNPEAVSYADHVLVAEKSTGGLTTFSWKLGGLVN